MIKYSRTITVREQRSHYQRPKLQPKISSAHDVYTHLSEYKHLDREHFICVTVDGASRIINTRVISIGTINQSLVHPREVYVNAIADKAVGILISHNHPSGQLSPSLEDKRITKRLKEVGAIVGIELLDHVILASEGYYSFRDEGLM